MSITHAPRSSLVLASLLLLAGGCGESGSQAASRDRGQPGASATEDAPQRAVCVLRSIGDAEATGQVTFHSGSDGVTVSGRIVGLAPGQHGFHVHEYGDVSGADDGKSAGGHYAPRGNPHGRRSAEQRHVGDLGNIEANQDGVAEFEFVDDVIELSGTHSIIGRSLVVHADPDDYGQPTGNAGARVAFGVIGRDATEDGGSGN